MSTCPAVGCLREIPPSMLMCRYHWHLVPKPIQTEVYRAHKAFYSQKTYTAGIAHAGACVDAVQAVATREGKTVPADNFWMQRIEVLKQRQEARRLEAEGKSHDPA